MRFMIALGIIKSEEVRMFMDVRLGSIVNLGVKATCV